MAELHCGDRIPRCDECGAIQHGGGSCFHHAWCSQSEVSQELIRLRAENEQLHSQLFALRVEVERLRDFMNWANARDVLEWEISWKQKGSE